MGDKYDEDVAFIKSLANILDGSDLTEIEIKREFGDDHELNVRLTRQPAATAAPAPLAMPVAAPAAVAAPAPVEAATTEASTTDLALHPGAITSPMVGTVYLQPEPGAGMFVGIGDQVSEGQTLLIIEAMKTMNQITAPRAGTVKRVLIDDGSPVEFGALLMIVE